MPDTTITLPDLPAATSHAQHLAALDALGLPHKVRSLTMDPDGITLTLIATDTDGHYLSVGDDAVYVTVHLPCTDTRETKAEHYIGRPDWCCAQAFQTLGKQHEGDCTRGQ